MSNKSKSNQNRSKSSSQSTKPKPSQSQNKASQPSGAQAKKAGKPVRKERGVWLTIALVLMAVHGIVAAYFYGTAKMGAYPNAQNWVVSLMVIHSLMNIIAAIGIWFWQRWALQVYAASAVLALIAGLLTGYGMYSAFYMILPVAIVGWLLRSKWEYFGINT